MKIKGKHIKLIFNVLWWVVTFFTALLLVGVLSAKIKGEAPHVLGYSVLKIVSGSMEPAIPTNSYILVKGCDPWDVKEGDIISFYSEDPTIYGIPNTHRVESVYRENTSFKFITKGDANPVEDVVHASGENLIGVYAGQLTWLTAFEKALHGKLTIILLIVLQLGIVAVFAGSAFTKSKE